MRLLRKLGWCVLLFPVWCCAQNKVVVIPMFGDEAEKLANVITVSNRNGDFDDPVAALDSITNAAAHNRYLVVIGPGVYQLDSPLVMKPFVDIVGSGRNATLLSASIQGSNGAASAAIVVGANNASISQLSLENNSSTAGQLSYGIYNKSVAPTISELNLVMSGQGNMFGIYNEAFASPVIDSVAIIIESSGVSPVIGIRNKLSRPVITDINITLSGGGGNQTGIRVEEFSFVVVSDCNIEVSNGTGGASQYGLTSDSSSSARIDNCDISVANNASDAEFSIIGSPKTYLSDSIVRGTVAGAKCSFVFTAGGIELREDCTPVIL